MTWELNAVSGREAAKPVLAPVVVSLRRPKPFDYRVHPRLGPNKSFNYEMIRQEKTTLKGKVLKSGRIVGGGRGRGGHHPGLGLEVRARKG